MRTSRPPRRLVHLSTRGPKLMPLMDETTPKDILDGILKVQQQQMKLTGLLQGSGGIRGCEIGRLARPSSPPGMVGAALSDRPGAIPNNVERSTSLLRDFPDISTCALPP